jgi:thiamine kinase-like enzyme
MKFNDEIKSKIEEIAGGNVESITKIGSGVNNAVYLINVNNKSFSLKIKERGIYDFFDNESTALRILDGFIAPKLYLYNDSDRDSKFLLLEYITGAPIKSISEIGISELALLVSKIHSRTQREKSIQSNLNTDLKAYLDDKCFSSIDELENIKFSKISELTKACNTVLKKSVQFDYSDPYHEVLIHGDLNVTNIIRDESGIWRLIDWELSRFAQIETEIAALIWAHCKTEQEISNLLSSKLCDSKKEAIAIMTLARGLDVSTWRTKWINSLDKNDEKLEFYHSELDEDWTKIKILEAYL